MEVMTKKIDKTMSEKAREMMAAFGMDLRSEDNLKSLERPLL